MDHLPESTSPRFALNAIDWEKLLRGGMVLLISAFFSQVLPRLFSFQYVFCGHDYTTVLTTIIFPMLVEGGRRFQASNPTIPPTL